MMGRREKKMKKIYYAVVNSRNEKCNGPTFLPHFIHIFLYNQLEDRVWIYFALCEFVSSNCRYIKKKGAIPLYIFEYVRMILQK